MKRYDVIPQERLKDVLITKTAIKTLKPEALVEKIVNFQFKDAREYTSIGDEIEISGFGKFKRSRSKTRKRLKNFEEALAVMTKNLADGSYPIERRANLENKRQSLKETVEFLRKKFEEDENRLKRDNGGSEEQNSSSRGIETINTADTGREDGHM